MSFTVVAMGNEPEVHEQVYRKQAGQELGTAPVRCGKISLVDD